uniref:Transcriptional regulator n=1 Tax=Steinernema glaseri TaxID=37863 RepID=A0A1I8AMV9_9BILA
MKDLAVNTGGTFVIVNDLTAKNGIAPVIQMHYRTQLVAFFSADDCSNADF